MCVFLSHLFSADLPSRIPRPHPLKWRSVGHLGFGVAGVCLGCTWLLCLQTQDRRLPLPLLQSETHTHTHTHLINTWTYQQDPFSEKLTHETSIFLFSHISNCIFFIYIWWSYSLDCETKDLRNELQAACVPPVTAMRPPPSIFVTNLC